MTSLPAASQLESIDAQLASVARELEGAPIPDAVRDTIDGLLDARLVLMHEELVADLVEKLRS